MQFHTSIRSFFISLSLHIASGHIKVKSIYFTEIVPGVPKEQFIYLSNFFSAPTKILSILSTSEFLTSEITKDLVLPDKEQVIGKVKISYSGNDKILIDWNKYLTYGDARVWNQLQHTFEKRQKIGDLKIQTDTAGEIEVAVYIGLKKPQLTIEAQPRFDNCMMNELCHAYLKLQNPTNRPLIVQLLISPENIFADLRRYDCIRHTHHEFVDDEFENINSDHDSLAKHRECLIKPTEEILPIKQATQKRPSLIKNLKNYDSGFISKIFQVFYGDLDYGTCPEHGEEWKNFVNYELWDQTQPFFIGGKNVAIIGPNASKVMGPVFFQPRSPGVHNISLVFRNNYTVIDAVTVSASAGYSKLGVVKRSIYLYNSTDHPYRNSIKKELQKLVIDVTYEELKKFVVGDYFILSPVFLRGFELQNLGNSDIEIKSIYFEGKVCELEGYVLETCKQMFLLKPQESISVYVLYTPSVSFVNKEIELIIHTSQDVVRYSVEVIIPQEFNLDVFLSKLGEESLIFALSCSLSLAVIFFQSIFINSFVYCRSISSKDLPELLPGRFFFKKYSQPIFFTKQEHVIPPPKPEKIEIPEVVEIPQVTRNKKKVKIKRNLGNTIIQKAEDLKLSKNQMQIPEVIATNKLLVDRKLKKIISDDPAPQTLKTSNSATEYDEDFYIDSYKTKNILFGGMNDKESIGLAELTQDSDPLDSLID